MPATVPTGGQGATGLGGLAALTDVLASAGTVLPAVGGPVVVAGTLNVLVGTPPPIPAAPAVEVDGTAGERTDDEARLSLPDGCARSLDMLTKSQTTAGFLAQVAPLAGLPSHRKAAPLPDAQATYQGVPEAPMDLTAAVVHIDASWRVHDSTVMASLGWTPGTVLVFTRTATGARLVRTGADRDAGAATVTIDARGRLLLPARQRRQMCLTQGAPLLLLADAVGEELTMTTPSTIWANLKESA